MAKKFLTHIDLSGNQLQNSTLVNAALESRTTDPTGSLGRIYFNTDTTSVQVYDGVAWVPLGEITSIVGTSNEIEVSVVNGTATISLPSTINADTSGNAATATKLATSRTISLAGDVVGSVGFDGSGNAQITATIQPNSVALGTDTTGDYVAGVSASTGISVSGSGGEGSTVTVINSDRGSSQNIFKNVSDGTTSVVADSNDDTLTIAGGTGISVTANATTDTLTVANTGVLSITGTAGEVNVDQSTGAVVIGLPDDVTVTGNLVVNGSFDVNGTVTTIDTNNLAVKDNIIVLNSGVTGAPSLNAGIEIERGTSADVQLRWNETSDKWQVTEDGSAYTNLALTGDSIASSQVTDFNEAAQDAVGTILGDTSTINLTYTDGTPAITADVTLATTSYLDGDSGLKVDITALETKLTTDGYVKSVSANVGNGAATSFALTHGLGTRDVQVQVYNNSSYDTVEVDVVRTSTNVVTVSFVTAPTSNAYRVVIVG